MVLNPCSISAIVHPSSTPPPPPPPPSSSIISSKMAGPSMDVDLLMEECDDMPDLVDMLPDGGKLPSLIDQNTQELTTKDPEEFVSVSFHSIIRAPCL